MMRLVALLLIAACGSPSPDVPADAAPPDTAPPDVPDGPPPPPPAALLELDRDTLSFDATLLGGTDSGVFNVKNVGEFPTGTLSIVLGGSGADQFQMAPACPPQLAAGASCAIPVTFAPSVSGPQTAAITLTATPGGTVELVLQGVAQKPPALEIVADTDDLGEATLGSVGTGVSTMIVRNIGDLDTGLLHVQPAGADPGEIGVQEQCSGHSLAPGESCPIEVRLEPHALGGKSAAIEVAASPGTLVSANVHGVAVGRAELYTVYKYRQLGTIAADASTTAVIEVTNRGDRASGLVTLTLFGSAGFTIPASTCANQPLAPGATCTVDVRLSSTVVGAKSTQLSIGAEPGDVQKVAIEGTVTSATQLAISPASFAYPTIAATATGATRTFTITNRGTSSTDALTTLASPHFSIVTDGCAGQALAPSATCEVAVRFTPGVPAPHFGELIVRSSTATTTAGLTGIALAPATLVLSRTDARFGSVVVGDTSAVTFDLRNTGGASAMPAIALTGADAGEFSVAHACTAPLAPSKSCAITVRFSPASIGTKTAALNGTPLTGTAVAAGGLVVSPTRFAFEPRVIQSGASLVQRFTIRNTGSTAVTSIAFAPSAGFTAVPIGDECPNGLQPGRLCSFTVKFTPSAIGPVAGTLAITSSADTLDLALDARGTPRLELRELNFVPATTFAFDHGVQAMPSELFVIARNNTDQAQLFSVLNTTAPWTFVSEDCAGIVQASASCTARLRFTPVAGPQTGTTSLVLGTAITATNSFQLQLSGEGQ